MSSGAHDAEGVVEHSGHGMKAVFMSTLELVIWGIGFAFEKATDVYMMGAMVVFLAVGWYFGGAIAHKVYMATCAQIHCPRVNNIRTCCCPWGFCIQDIVCPCLCHKFRQTFGLRVHLVKARHLKVDMLGGDIDVYCRVWAGNNPLKTTSIQTYNNPNMLNPPTNYGNFDRSGWQTVIWNEPIDLVIYPSIGMIYIVLHTTNILGMEETLGTVYMEVGGFYEDDKAPCSYCWFDCCDHCPGEDDSFPKSWIKPTWPLIQGAPSLEELQQHHEISTATCTQTLYRTLGLNGLTKIGAGLFKEREELTPADDDMNRVTQVLADEGMQLENAHPKFRASKDTVVIAVRDDPDAMQFASKALQNNILIQRIQHKLPEPQMLEIMHNGKFAGYMWSYMILTHEVSCENELRYCIMSFIRTFCCCLVSSCRWMEPQRQELPNYQFVPVGEPVGVQQQQMR